jgi:hypothetical protein
MHVNFSTPRVSVYYTSDNTRACVEESHRVVSTSGSGIDAEWEVDTDALNVQASTQTQTPKITQGNLKRRSQASLKGVEITKGYRRGPRGKGSRARTSRGRGSKGRGSKGRGSRGRGSRGRGSRGRRSGSASLYDSLRK